MPSKKDSTYERSAEKARKDFTDNKFGVGAFSGSTSSSNGSNEKDKVACLAKNHSSDLLLRIQRQAELGDPPALKRKRAKLDLPQSKSANEQNAGTKTKKGLLSRIRTKRKLEDEDHDNDDNHARGNKPSAQVNGGFAEKGGSAMNGDGKHHSTQSSIDVEDCLRDGLSFFERLQCDDGHFPGDYGGPMFLMPGLIIVLYVTKHIDKVLTIHHKREMIRYLKNHQRDDGGYGLHIEGERSTMFGTVLSYVSLRLLGVDADDATCVKARKWIIDGGGAVHIPSWGKFWLCVLGVYDWSGLNPMPPEMWLLPYTFNPLHPGRFWCHCRMVYLPMSYVYGKRGTGEATVLTNEIKSELYCGDYGSIDWDKSRNQCHSNDLYYPHPFIQDVVWYTLHRLEPLLLPGGSLHWLRTKALKEVMKLVHYEDVNTRYVDIGPVNKVVNMLCCWLDDDKSIEGAFEMHLPRVMDYLWVAEDGMKMQGYNGSQLWDTAFAAQALEATGLVNEFQSMAIKMQSYIDASQVREDCPGPLQRYYRHISKGAWPFSTRDHGWPITDCSSEGLKAALFLNEQDFRDGNKSMPRISDERLFDCVQVILSFQNSGGGWATYENTRSVSAVEILNPAETFGDIMIDYSYVECSTACITALSRFAKKYPNHRTDEIESALSRGKRFILNEQLSDGSWYGSWGVCFTYAMWFGCESLHALGEEYESCEALRKACKFLLDKQRPDGGWGESYLSCQDKVYSQLPPGEASHVVNTSWAILALIYAGQHTVDDTPLRKAASFLMKMQNDDGDWPQQHISGVFNRNCMITYANYRNIFPLWALGEYRKKVDNNYTTMI